MEALEKALCLHFAALRDETPAWARTTAWAALAYLILPIDAIPDWIPATGYSDDLVALGYAIVTINQYVDETVKTRARETLERWFPNALDRLEKIA